MNVLSLLGSVGHQGIRAIIEALNGRDDEQDAQIRELERRIEDLERNKQSNRRGR